MSHIKKLTASLLALIMIIGIGFSSVADTGDDLEYAKAFVERLYVNMMGRASDEEGLNYWVNQLYTDALNGDQVADGFYNSPEFTEISAGLTNEEYAQRMYVTILDREADPEGLSYWTSELDTGNKTRLEVYKGFLGSPEWASICDANDIISGHYQVGLFVDRLYNVILERDADSIGRSGWSSMIANGEKSAIEVTYGFFFSDEYLAKNKSNSDYVKDLYSTFMGREYDDTGLSYWTAKLDEGSTRLTVMNGFAVSDEFTSICEQYHITRGDAIPETNGITVCIDPGHSAVMPGGTCPLGPGSSTTKPADAIGTYGSASKLNEYDLTLTIAFQLKAELEDRGYTVIMTHTDNNSAHDLVERAMVANNGADIMVRLHADGISNTSVTGCSAITITRTNPWNPQTYSESRRLADNLLTSYVAATGIRNRGVVEEDTMAGNNWSTVPCVLFEMGFMTNRTEDLKMADPNFQVSMVQGLANGIDAYYGF